MEENFKARVLEVRVWLLFGLRALRRLMGFGIMRLSFPRIRDP